MQVHREESLRGLGPLTRGVREPHLASHQLQGQEVVLLVQAAVVEEEPTRLHSREPVRGGQGGFRSQSTSHTRDPVTQSLSTAGGGGGHLREGQREVEALPQAAEHDEGARREGAGRHLASRAFEGAAHGALATEAAVGRVGAGAPVAADAWHAASSLRVQLAVFSWRHKSRFAGSHGPAPRAACFATTPPGSPAPRGARPRPPPQPGSPSPSPSLPRVGSAVDDLTVA